jgi:hypothetical protein
MKTMMAPVLFALAVIALPMPTELASAQPAQPPVGAPELPPSIQAFIKPLEAAPGDSELLKKFKERHNTGVRLLEERVKEYKNGTRDMSPVFEAAKLVVEAKMDMAENAKAKVAVLEQTLDLATLFEKRLQEQLDKGFGSHGDLERARYARLTVEVELLKAKQK